MLCLVGVHICIVRGALGVVVVFFQATRIPVGIQIINALVEGIHSVRICVVQHCSVGVKGFLVGLECCFLGLQPRLP